MVKNIFFRTVQKSYDDLEKNLQLLLEETCEEYIISKAERCLLRIDEEIRKLKSNVLKYQFDSIAGEVYFFKVLKPKFISQYLFYLDILTIESKKPNSNIKLQIKFYEHEIKKCLDSLDTNKSFFNYYKREATYLDHKYFVRYNFDIKMKLPSHLYNLDEHFSTLCDFQVAKIISNEYLLQYLNSKIAQFVVLHTSSVKPVKDVNWSMSKVALVELIYALHQNQCFNAGALELSETIKIFENLLTIDLSNFHKVLAEIRSRKFNRTKFLTQLQDNLEKKFVDNDS